MSVLIVCDIFGSVINLTTTEEFLSVRASVKNDTKGGSHVDGLAVLVPVDVLFGISASVAVDVLKSVGDVGFSVVNGIVIRWLSDLTDPRAHSHELLTRSLLNGEEVVSTTVLVLAFGSGASLAGFLVQHHSTLAIGIKFSVIIKSAWSRSSRGSTAHFVLFFVRKVLIINIELSAPFIIAQNLQIFHKGQLRLYL